MSVLVTDQGFCPAPETDWTALEDLGPETRALDLPPDADPDALAAHLAGVEIVRVDFPSFADGRGFSVAKGLRRAGFAGRLRAKGHVLADQYAMARRCGFDEVEIDDGLARRQPEGQWLARVAWAALSYRDRFVSRAP